MDFLQKSEFYLFLLAALLIGVVYYVGLKSDAAVVGGGLNTFFNTITGRDPSGKFQGVPQAA
jgi:uncharacterized oligopeptide transporter (OPT) family protein